MRLNWTKAQLEILKKMEISFDVTGILTDDQICELDEIVSDFMLMHYVGDEGIYGDGRLC